MEGAGSGAGGVGLVGFAVLDDVHGLGLDGAVGFDVSVYVSGAEFDLKVA